MTPWPNFLRFSPKKKEVYNIELVAKLNAIIEELSTLNTSIDRLLIAFEDKKHDFTQETYVVKTEGFIESTLYILHGISLLNIDEKVRASIMKNLNGTVISQLQLSKKNYLDDNPKYLQNIALALMQVNRVKVYMQDVAEAYSSREGHYIGRDFK